MSIQMKMILMMVVGGVTAVVGTILLFHIPAEASAALPAVGSGLSDEVIQIGFITAALSTGISAIAAAMAVSKVGAAAVGSLTEKPELFGKLLIYIGLAEGIAIYGLIVSILILNRL